MHLAAGMGKVNAVEKLCCLGASTSALDQQNATPLDRAIIGSTESQRDVSKRPETDIAQCADILLRNGAPVEGFSVGCSPLLFAV